jgi:hypothetical protein
MAWYQDHVEQHGSETFNPYDDDDDELDIAPTDEPSEFDPRLRFVRKNPDGSSVWEMESL